jgi:hypothetical protein
MPVVAAQGNRSTSDTIPFTFTIFFILLLF